MAKVAENSIDIDKRDYRLLDILIPLLISVGPLLGMLGVGLRKRADFLGVA